VCLKLINGDAVIDVDYNVMMMMMMMMMMVILIDTVVGSRGIIIVVKAW
jgi:hypothetical protein